MMYRTAYRNAKGESVPCPKPELSEQYKDLVMKRLQDAQVSYAAVPPPVKLLSAQQSDRYTYGATHVVLTIQTLQTRFSTSMCTCGTGSACFLSVLLLLYTD